MRNASSVSAIVTCHNYGRFLSRCLDSLLAQTVPFSEILVVDDASSDETAGVAARYQGRVSCTRVEYRNPARARQAGYEKTSGDFLVMIDADDWFEPQFNAKLLAALMADPSAGLAYCGAVFDLESGDVLGFPGNGKFAMLPFDKRRLLRGNYIPNCAMVRRQAWLGQDPSLEILEDWDHWIRITRAGWRGVLVREPLFHYRIHQANRTRRLSVEEARQFAKALEKKHSPQELTVLMILDKRFNRRNLRSLRTRIVEDPFFSDRVHLLVVNNTGDSSIRRDLEMLGADVISFAHGPHYSWKKGYRPDMAEAQHRSRLLLFARRYVIAPQVLWLEPYRKVSWSVYERMAAKLKSSGAAVVSCGAVADAGCALMETRTFQNFPFPIGLRKLQSGRFAGVLNAWLISQGMRWEMMESRSGQRSTAAA